ncbi:hypothetical protein ALI22I_14080 [Saccharothrix sp. ALI-22-I]|uniref:NACHT domain-containing protein n=1 Tax=Saccharothrix sp. ALI-22-I TaxID=1933778 RepID=UPI00097BE8B1|nr:AAA family ATPase [Saccharothrix sp. ALI-22-I]ONI90030.1 hypothetical protein ALI22I_14080 [Saccharothrix sp. ALI-22-I]
MPRPALFSYEGALRVLGRYDRPWLDKADVFLGVGILVGGAVEPDVLSLVDPKNEATASLRKILDGITDKLTGLNGVHRHELIAAAHTIIAVTSVFDAFRDEIGPVFDTLQVTDREKFRALGAEPDGKKEVTALPSLTALNVPAPNATRGFQENLTIELSRFFAIATDLVTEFLDGLGARPPQFHGTRFRHAMATTSREKYTHHYLGLAGAIPEFRIWALLGEHAATRAAIRRSDAKFAEALEAVRTESLEVFSTLLSQLSSGQLPPSRTYRKKLEHAATAVLGKPLLRGGSDTSTIDAVFPTVERGFVAPGYRLTVYHEKTQPSSEGWWDRHTEVRDDIDTFLAAHLSGPDSTTLPLLVLGNPGAGKSLLVDVLAARLPADRFTVVTVQLRKVRAEDPVHEQIETALTEVFAERVGWGRLADECEDSTRVVLLDGFDELIQASGVQQSAYIQQVRDFQEREADLGRPVAVVITSRMLVADRARIPVGVPIVKLEEFDDERVDRWLEAWNDANTSTSGFRPLSQAQLVHHSDLARQPLILLMLVIYAADPDNPPLDDHNLSKAELYGRLIRSFILRQVRDKSSRRPSEDHVTTRAAQSGWQLGIAALAMFNRGRQYVTDRELNQDLAVFAPAEATAPATTLDTPVSDADRTVENFFFIHAAALNEKAETGRRSYEFLHATFGEYLIAEVTLTLLRQMVVQRALPAANPYLRSAPPDDSLLYTLISHQPFVKRKPILELAAGLFAALDQGTRTGVLAVLDDLIRSFHDRARSDPHPDYAPARTTLVSRIATYSANLVCLRVLLDKDVPTPVQSLFRHEEDSLDPWRSTVRLWQSGLDKEGWQSLVDELTLVHDGSWHITRREVDLEGAAGKEAQLLGDATLEGMMHTGRIFVSDDITSAPDEQFLLRKLARWIVLTSGTTGRRGIPYDVDALNGIISRLDAGTPMNRGARACMSSALSREAQRLPRDVVERGLRHLIPKTPEECRDREIRPFELISAVCSHPDLVGLGVLPAELLPHLFRGHSLTALPAVVLTWLTVTSGDQRVDGAFHEFAAQVGEAARPYLGVGDSAYLPVEAFDYLAHQRAVEPPFGETLLRVLYEVSHAVAGAVEPRTFLDVVERFANSSAESRPDDASIEGFITAYLADRGVDIAAGGTSSAPDVLRRLAGEQDERHQSDA